MPDKLCFESVLNCIVKVINLIKVRALNSRLFAVIKLKMIYVFVILNFYNKIIIILKNRAYLNLN